MCLPGLSLLVSALFRWPCSIPIRFSPSPARWCPPFSVGHVAFLFICVPGLSLLVSSISIHLPGLSLLVSALFRWRCNISIRLSPRSVTGGVRPFPLFLFICLPCLVSALVRWPCSISIHLSPGLSLVVSALFRCFYSFVSQVCHCWCPPFSVGHVAFLFICLPGLSLPVSALFHWPCSSILFRWPCSNSILLSPRSVTGVSLSIGHEAFLFICLPGPSLLVPCSISIHLSFRSVTGGVRPCPLAMKHFYSLVSQVCHCWCPPFSTGDATFLFICFPGLSLLVSALFRWPCSISIHLFPGSGWCCRPFPLAM